MLRVLVYVIPIILGVYAFVDCIQTEDKDVRFLPKLAWIAIIVLLWIIGPVAWLLAGRDRSRVGRGIALPGTRPAGAPGSQPRPPRRIVAPDDDPDFLQQLTRDRRRREEQASREQPSDPTPPEHPDPPDDDGPESGSPAPRA
jgi:hypothetical protein